LSSKTALKTFPSRFAPKNGISQSMRNTVDVDHAQRAIDQMRRNLIHEASRFHADGDGNWQSRMNRWFTVLDLIERKALHALDPDIEILRAYRQRFLRP
jgi:hypothetical protein